MKKQDITDKLKKSKNQMKKVKGKKHKDVQIINGMPFDFRIHDDETLSCNIVFESGGIQEIYHYYADNWDDVIGNLCNYYELKKALNENCHVKAVWFEKTDK